MVGIEWRFTCCWISIGVCLLFPVFWASGKSFAAAWDVWVDGRKAWTRFRFPSEEKARLARLVKELTS